MSNPFLDTKVLIVEDEAFLSKILRERLEEEGFKEVHLATSGTEAVEKVKTVKPDLVLLDLILPNMNGFDVLKKIKENPETEKIPVLILSNLGQERDIEQAKVSGAVDYIVKSNFSLQTIVDKLKKLIEEGN